MAFKYFQPLNGENEIFTFVWFKIQLWFLIKNRPIFYESDGEPNITKKSIITRTDSSRFTLSSAS